MLHVDPIFPGYVTKLYSKFWLCIILLYFNFIPLHGVGVPLTCCAESPLSSSRFGTFVVLRTLSAISVRRGDHVGYTAPGRKHGEIASRGCLSCLHLSVYDSTGHTSINSYKFKPRPSTQP